MQNIQDNILTLLTDRGYIISRQRRIIIDSLCKLKDIGSVEDFWMVIRQRHHVSWATVHKTVRLLEELGYITRTNNCNRQQQYKLSAI